MPKEYFLWYQNKINPADKFHPGNLSLFMAEDYITSNGLRNLGYNVKHDYYNHISPEISKEWHKVLGERFIVVSCRQVNIVNLKYPLSSYLGNSKSLTHATWKKYAGLYISKKEIFITSNLG